MNRKSHAVVAAAVKSIKAKKLTGCSPVESLEGRLFLSGSVLASVSNGVLVVRGDLAANVIVLDQTGLTADQVRVSGDSSTAINDQFAPVIFSGITGGARVGLGAGDDRLTVSDIDLAGGLSINAQDGTDLISINDLQVERTLSIRTGLSLSTTTVANTTVGEDFNFHSGSGRQTLTLVAVEVAKGTSLHGATGADTFAIDDSTFHGRVRIRTAGGDDVVQIETDGSSSGPTTLFEGRTAISLNKGDDTLTFGVPSEAGNQPVFASRLLLSGGAGEDTRLYYDDAMHTGAKGVSSYRFELFTLPLDVTAPTVTSATPVPGATGIARNRKVAGTFSEAMALSTVVSPNVTVTGPGSANVAGSISVVGNTMTFTPNTDLAANTLYTLTITTAVTDVAGNPLAADFVSTFTTGATLDVTAPLVSSTNPAANETGVALNRTVAATFNEAMDPATIIAANVTVTGPGSTPVVGTVSYAGSTMTFTPDALLTANTVYTLTITTGAEDLAGNALASNFVSTFTTGAALDIISPTVTLTNPTNGRTNVVLNKTIAATFSEAMAPLSFVGNVTVVGPGNTPVVGTLSYDTASNIAAFTPSSNLASNTTYTATITGGINGVKDLAGNELLVDKVWSFTTGTQIAQAPINLGAASTFAVMAKSAITSTGNTLVNGDVGLNPGTAQGIPGGQVNGTIHVNDSASSAAQTDLLAAYNDAISRTTTPQTLAGNIGGLTITPGLYVNSSSVQISGSGSNNIVTLDAEGDPNAVFIFKMSSTLTTAPGAQVVLAGGAKSSNIFWQVGSSATLDTTTIFKGTIMAAVTITANTGTVVEGRLLAGSTSSGAVTLGATTVTVPSL